MATEFEIGITLIGMTDLSDLAEPVPAPEPRYKQYATGIDLGDLSKRGLGNPSAVWRWAFLTSAQRDQLKVFCPGASAQVYIRTRKRDSANEYAIFLCQMIWPEEEEYRAGHVLDFEIIFRDMVEQEE